MARKSDLKINRKYRFYICGRCKTPIPYLKTENPPIPCPDCGYHGKEKDYKDVPSELKYPIN